MHMHKKFWATRNFYLLSVIRVYLQKNVNDKRSNKHGTKRRNNGLREESAIYNQSGMVLSRHGLGSALDVKHLNEKFDVNFIQSSNGFGLLWRKKKNVGQMSVFWTFFFHSFNARFSSSMQIQKKKKTDRSR